MIKNERLLNIFNLANEKFYSDLGNKSAKSFHWEQYDKRVYNIKTLLNFREKEGLSVGLDDSALISFKSYPEYVNLLTEEFILNNMCKENIGNSPFNVLYKQHYVDPNKLVQLIWYKILYESMYLDKLPKNVCEIGGGFGSFAEVIIRNLDSKILLIDLPEANLMSAYYLKENFPERKLYLFDDYQLNEFLSFDDYNKNDIIILPPNCNIDEAIKFDLFVNSRSMMEMNLEVISDYFNFIQKHISANGYFLNINRYEKRIAGVPIRISEYPYDQDWQVIRSHASPGQNHIRFLLTKRTNIFTDKNIHQHLQDIHNLLKSNPSLRGPGA